MGLFDNPKYFLAKASTTSNSDKLTELTRVKATPLRSSPSSIQQSQSQTLTKNESIFIENTPSTTEHIYETTHVTTSSAPNVKSESTYLFTTTTTTTSSSQSKKTQKHLVFTKIMLTLCIGYLLNHTVVFLLAFPIINIKYKQEEERNYAVYAIYLYAIGAIMSMVYYALTLVWIWRPRKSKLAIAAAIQFIHIIIMILYPFATYDSKAFSVKYCIQSHACIKDISNIFLIFLIDLISIILILFERAMLK